jgi:hypothetical protein
MQKKKQRKVEKKKKKKGKSWGKKCKKKRGMHWLGNSDSPTPFRCMYNYNPIHKSLWIEK